MEESQQLFHVKQRASSGVLQSMMSQLVVHGGLVR